MNYVEDAIKRLQTKLPGLDRDLTRLYALLLLNHGLSTTVENVHNAWSVWQNEKDPNHRSLIPFHLLTDEVQELDRKYAEAIWKVWLDIQASNC